MHMVVINDWIKEICYRNKIYKQWVIKIITNMQSQVIKEGIEDANSLSLSKMA